MNIRIVFTLCVCLMSFLSISQNDLERILIEIEQNNEELNGASLYIESQKYALKSNNSLSDPEIEAYYMPFGQHLTGDYAEFQLSQAFDFPTLYGARKAMGAEQEVLLQLQYKILRQDVLSQAQQHFYRLSNLQKRIDAEQQRFQYAELVYQHAKSLFEKEEIGLIELNKVKLVFMQYKFNLEDLMVQKSNTITVLNALNGGNDLNPVFEGSGVEMTILDSLSIWQDRITTDANLLYYEQLEMVAEGELGVARNERLPAIAIGYNYQGVAGQNYSGFYAGMSIPLWNNRNKVRSAQFNVDSQRSSTASKIELAKALFNKEYYSHRTMLNQYEEYTSTLSSMTSDSLLYKAYVLGEISFTEYYLETEFNHSAHDALLELELKINLSSSSLFKHQL